MGLPGSGPSYLLRGMGLIARPGLRRFVLIPLLINSLLFSAAFFFALNRIEDWIAWIEQQLSLPEALSWLQTLLEWVLWPLFLALLLLLVIYSFTLVANLIAAPFNSLLAERVEALLQGRSPTGSLSQAFWSWIPGLFGELRKLFYLLFWSAFFLILSLLLPLVGSLFWFAFSAWMMALQYLDVPMSNHGLQFREIRRRLRQRPWLVLSFGAGVLVLSLVPLLNFLTMPSAVAGATALWVDHWDAESQRT